MRTRRASDRFGPLNKDSRSHKAKPWLSLVSPRLSLVSLVLSCPPRAVRMGCASPRPVSIPTLEDSFTLRFLHWINTFLIEMQPFILFSI